MMEKLSTNFYRDEFACSDGCGKNTVDAGLLVVLQWLWWEIGSEIIIESGHRCPAHNEKVGGSNKSQHLEGKAADIRSNSHSPQQIYNIIDTQYPDRLGLICYPSKGIVHVDSRSTLYRHVF